jgi:hypothetical protein
MRVRSIGSIAAVDLRDLGQAEVFFQILSREEENA